MHVPTLLSLYKYYVTSILLLLYKLTTRYIIKSKVLLYNNYLISYAFYSLEYIIIDINFSLEGKKISIYFNLDYLITLSD